MNNLAKLYIRYMSEDYHSSASIPKKQQMKFIEREMDLINAGISLTHYAQTVSKLFMGWCEEKQVYYIPAQIFVSEYAYQRYLDFREKATVKLEEVDNSQKVFFTELQLCTVLFNSLRSETPTTEEHLVDVFMSSASPLVCQEWKDLSNRRPVKIAVCKYYIEFGSDFKTNKVLDDYYQLYSLYLDNASKKLQTLRKRLKQAKKSDVERLKMNVTELETEIRVLERNLLDHATVVK